MKCSDCRAEEGFNRCPRKIGAESIINCRVGSTHHREQTLEGYIEELRKKRPEKCQSCECHFVTFDFKLGGYVWKCETAPECYQEPTQTKGAFSVNL